MIRRHHHQIFAPRVLRDRYSRLAADSAFSMVELVIVMIIISMLASLAVPRFAESIARRRAESAAYRVVADLKLTAQLARTTSQSHRMRLISSQNAYALEASSNGITWTSVEGQNNKSAAYVVSLDESPYHAQVEGDGETRDAVIEFDGYGIAQDSAVILLTIGKIQKTVTVQAGSSKFVIGERVPHQANQPAKADAGPDSGPLPVE